MWRESQSNRWLVLYWLAKHEVSCTTTVSFVAKNHQNSTISSGKILWKVLFLLKKDQLLYPTVNQQVPYTIIFEDFHLVIFTYIGLQGGSNSNLWQLLLLLFQTTESRISRTKRERQQKTKHRKCAGGTRHFTIQFLQLFHAFVHMCCLGRHGKNAFQNLVSDME